MIVGSILGGQQVKTLCIAALSKGNNYLERDGKDDNGRVCASGVYLLKADAEGIRHTKKIMKLK
jgi:flagellar hook assembly protein FlgD